MRSRPTVVIVDDSAELRAVVRARLQASGLFDVVDEAGDGREAWELADGLQPDLLLLDTSMPEMDGIEALPLIRAVAPRTRIVMYAGVGEAGLTARARSLGATDLIEKSLPVRELPERLWSVVGAGATGERPRRWLRVAGADDLDGVRAQELLDDHVARSREIFGLVPVAMAVLTLGGTILRVNAAFADLMQCDPADVLGLDYGMLAAGRGDAFDDALRRLLAADGPPISFEHPALDGAGGVLCVTLVRVPDARGRVLHVLAQVQET